jgi:hypothetical protein
MMPSATLRASSTDVNLTNWTKFEGDHGSVVLYVPEAIGADKDKYLPEAGSQFIFRNETDGTWGGYDGREWFQRNQRDGYSAVQRPRPQTHD